MNVFFTIYEDCGKIIRSGYCSDDDFYKQNKENLNILKINSDPINQYIDCGLVVNMPEKPDKPSYFDYDTKQWVLDTAAQEQFVKLERSRLLAESDWTQLPDVPLVTKTAWAQYRQELRDITTQEGYPFEIMWPAKPE